MHAVIETPDFIADAKSAGVTDQERSKIIDTLAKNPLAGVEIKGTGGARKIRFAGRGKGKSGGYRVITFTVAWTCRCSCSTCLQKEIGLICPRLTETISARGLLV